MTTKAIPTIVPETIQPDVAKFLSDWSSYINETVAFGSHILNWVGQSGKLGGDEEIPLIMTFRNILELMDSISILLRHSSTEPCKNLLRSILESIFVIEYIIKDNSKHRCYDYLTGHYMRKLNIYKKLDPTAEQGKQFRSELKDDELAGGMTIPNINNLDKMTANIKSILNKSEFSSSLAEYNRMKQIKRGKPNWYSFFGGPNNIIELARHLKLLGLYNVLYRQFSNNVHGMDVIDRRISAGTPGETLITQIRAPFEAQTIFQLTLSFALRIYKKFIGYYIPEKNEDLAKWYVSEIREIYNEISSRKILNVE